MGDARFSGRPGVRVIRARPGFVVHDDVTDEEGYVVRYTWYVEGIAETKGRWAKSHASGAKAGAFLLTGHLLLVWSKPWCRLGASERPKVAC